MMRAAVVNIEDNVVVGIIIADASTDVPYAGTFLVDVDFFDCQPGWIYDPKVGDFVNPNPPPPETPVEVTV
jgi:hypothetical protein